jgi:hypothetical protein
MLGSRLRSAFDLPRSHRRRTFTVESLTIVLSTAGAFPFARFQPAHAIAVCVTPRNSLLQLYVGQLERLKW